MTSSAVLIHLLCLLKGCSVDGFPGPLTAGWEDTQHQVCVVRPLAFASALGAEWERQPQAPDRMSPTQHLAVPTRALRISSCEIL